jgi:maltose alpha-D-glucosyltransferase / alpha-amylase
MTSPHTPAASPVEVDSRWDALFEPPASAALERALASYVEARRWYRTKTKHVVSAKIAAAFRLPHERARARLALVEITKDDGERDTYVLPLAFVSSDEAGAIVEKSPQAAVLPLHVKRDGEVREGMVVDALFLVPFLDELWDALATGAQVEDSGATLRFSPLEGAKEAKGPLSAKLLGREQTNTSIVYGGRFVGKIVRKIDEGEGPDVEMGRFLTAARYAGSPAMVGSVEVIRGGSPSTVGVFHEMVQNEGDAWEHALAALRVFLDDPTRPATAPPSAGPSDLFALATEGPSREAIAAVGPYAELSRLLGERVGEMHAALASRKDVPAFGPEPLDAATRVTLARAAEAELREIVAELRAHPAPEDARELASGVVGRESELAARVAELAKLGDPGVMIRVHGDLHLGQVLFTGDDFAIIDFEGEPARPLHERRAKRSPFADLAGMLRSYHYAAAFALRAKGASAELARWAALFQRVSSGMFLRGWLGKVRGTGIVPDDPRARRVLLSFFLLEKCLYEVKYEMNNRPDWLAIPLDGLRELLEANDG